MNQTQNKKLPPEQAFHYDEFTTRNIGFVTREEQQKIRESSIFICGVGGMGGACLQAIVRSGVENIAIADFDHFDISNLNRQPFAFVSTNGVGKVEATKSRILDINPDIKLETFGEDWPKHIDQILEKYPIVINGMDDVRATVFLYRKAKAHQATIVDAYMSPLPSVYVVRPKDQRPEERLSYPSVEKDPFNLSDEEVNACVEKEIIWVLTHSSSANHIVLDIAAEVVAGKRSRMSFAPMVLATGNLMAFEAMKLILGKKPASNKGYFVNPWTQKAEHPLFFLWGFVKKILVKQFLKTLLKKG